MQKRGIKPGHRVLAIDGHVQLDLVDNKVCAIDDVWSGLRVVVRKERRAAWSGG